MGKRFDITVDQLAEELLKTNALHADFIKKYERKVVPEEEIPTETPRVKGPKIPPKAQTVTTPEED